MATRKLTIRLPEDEIEFAKGYAARHGMTMTQLIDRYLRWIPAHYLTTLHSLVAKHAGREQADELIDWLLRKFTVAPADKSTFLRARLLGFTDFEGAVVCASAEQQNCRYIITRNSSDFANAGIPALTPGEFLAG